MFQIARNGKEIGQFSEEDIREQLAAGKLTPRDLAWSAGMKEWLRVGELNLTRPPILENTHTQEKRTPGVAVTSFSFGLLALPGVIAMGLVIYDLVSLRESVEPGLTICGLCLLPVSIVAGVIAIITGHIAGWWIKGRKDLKGLRFANFGLAMGYVATALLYLAAFGFWYIAFREGLGFTQDVRVKSDIASIDTQLKVYYGTNGFYPTTEQGLQALVTPPDSEPRPRQWRQLMSKQPLDPWGLPYIYIYPGKHNPDGFDVYSAGPDRKADTADDIGNWQN